MDDPKLEFPKGCVGGGGGGIIGQIPSVGGMDIFWKHTLFGTKNWAFIVCVLLISDFYYLYSGPSHYRCHSGLGHEGIW